MKRTIRPDSRPASRRRGVTLVEMLVTVAMLVIIMTILVQVFQAATGALSAAQAIQQLDDQLQPARRDDPLGPEGVTARFTPPLDPAQNLGYFEYGENEFADIQGEDSDDYIRFTAKAPPGRPFTGRMWVDAARRANASWVMLQRQRPAGHDHQRLRRDHLLPPQRQPLPPRAVDRARASVGDRAGDRQRQASYDRELASAQPATRCHFHAVGARAGMSVSWQGVNDLSARPAATGPNSNAASTLTLAPRRRRRSSSTRWAT